MDLLVHRIHDDGVRRHEVLPALQAAQASDFGIVDLHHRTVAIAPHGALHARRAHLAMLAQNVARAVEPYLGKIKRPAFALGARSAYEDIVVARSLGKLCHLGAGDLEGVLVEALPKRHLPARLIEPNEIRIAREISFGENDEVGAVFGRFGNKFAAFLDGGVQVKKDRRCLNCGDPDFLLHCSAPFKPCVGAASMRQTTNPMPASGKAQTSLRSRGRIVPHDTLSEMC